MSVSSRKAPAGIGFDKHDNVYVSEIGNDRVQVFDKDGNYLALHGLIVDRETGWIYVADTANDRVQVFRPAEQSS